MPELSSATIRATVIAHAIRLGKCPAPGVVIDFKLQMQEIKVSDLDAGKLDRATLVEDHGRVWFTVTADDIEAGKKLINAQKAIYTEPKMTKVWLE